MGKLLNFALDLVPGGSLVKGIVGGVFHAISGGSFSEGYSKSATPTQVTVTRDTAEIIFLVWFLALLTGFFFDFSRPHVIEGFTAMREHLPDAWENDLHKIVAGLFVINLGHKFLDKR